MAQGQRYDPKTKTGWKFENGRSNYYVKGKKLSQLEIVKRGLAEGGENIKDFATEVFAPITSGAQTLRDKMTRDPRSPVGDNVWTHNKKLLALQAQLDKDPQVIANQQALAISKSPSEFFGTNQYGDRNAQITNEIQASNSSPIGKLTIGVDGEIDPQLRRALGMETGQITDGDLSTFRPTTYEPGGANQVYAKTSSAKENVSTDEKDPAEVIEKNQEIKGAIKEPGSEKNKEKIQISDDSKNFIPTVMDIENDARTFGQSEKGMQRKLKMMIDKQKADALKQAQQALKNAAKVA